MPRPPRAEYMNALQDLLRSKDVYNLDVDSTRKPYDENNLSLSKVTAHDLAPLLSREAHTYATQPWEYIVKSDYMIDDEGP